MEKVKNNKKGFTLAELLIVVAIIGVLVAVSVPIFKGSLEKAKNATNNANIRSAKAAATAEYLLDDEANGKTGTKNYIYDVDKGTVKEGSASEEATKGKNDVYETIKVTITVDENGDITEVKTVPKMKTEAESSGN